MEHTTAWHVYLIECADKTLYCGITTDLARRMAQHDGRLPGGAKYTRKRGPVRLVASRACPDRSVASRLEAVVKKARRHEKILVLESSLLA